MRFMMMVKHAENTGRPPKELMEAMASLSEEAVKAGTMLGSGGLAPTAQSTRVRISNGQLTVTDGPFAETKEALAGVFVLDVPDLDAAIGWAEKCPGAQWGVIEVRPTATAFVDGAWTR